jgi:hypothetical protein
MTFTDAEGDVDIYALEHGYNMAGAKKKSKLFLNPT